MAQKICYLKNKSVNILSIAFFSLLLTACGDDDKPNLNNAEIHEPNSSESSGLNIAINDYDRDSVVTWNDSTEWSFKKGSATGKLYVFEDGSWRKASDKESSAIELISPTPANYAKGRAMNARLGRGINLGNSWDSDSEDDAGWSNPIRDTDFATIKAAGFNSVRIPVRWQKNSDYTTHTVDPSRLKGVMEDIQLAIDQDLAVVVNFQHYDELMCAGGAGSTGATKCQYDSLSYLAEKSHFLALWGQIAKALDVFPDNMLVLEILNEPLLVQAERVNQLMNEAYSVIRNAAPGKTIMFESYHASKFEDLTILRLPVNENEGNVIYSGHYYEPYTYTHQGMGYDCVGDKAKRTTAAKDFKSYVGLAKLLYPDVNGVDHIPMNLGEFGVSAGELGRCNNGTSPSDEGRIEWTKATAQAAIDNGMSFHYWAFGLTGGYDAYDVRKEKWVSGFPQALTE